MISHLICITLCKVASAKMKCNCVLLGNAWAQRDLLSPSTLLISSFFQSHLYSHLSHPPPTPPHSHPQLFLEGTIPSSRRICLSDRAGWSAFPFLSPWGHPGHLPVFTDLWLLSLTTEDSWDSTAMLLLSFISVSLDWSLHSTVSKGQESVPGVTLGAVYWSLF